MFNRFSPAAKFCLVTCLLVGFVLGTVIVGHGSESEDVEVAGPTIKIGGLLQISGVGADCGKREHVGAQLAVNEINEAGGINGIPLKLVAEDTASDPQEALMMSRRLAKKDKVLAIVGPHYSSSAEVTFPSLNKLNVAQIAVASSKPGVAKTSSWGFRNTATEDKIAGPVVESVLANYDVDEVALFYDSKEAICTALAEVVFPPQLESRGVEIINKNNPITYETGKPEFSAEITRLKSLDPDAVMLGGLGIDALNIVTEARNQGLDVPFFGGAPLFEGNVPQKGGEAVNNIYAGTTWYYGMPSEQNQSFVEGFEELAPDMYSKVIQKPTYYAPNAYDAVYMIKEAIEEMGVTNESGKLATDREKIQEYLSQLRDFDGVASLGFDEVGDGIKQIYVLKTHDGEWELVQKVTKGD